jgi:SOS-response transcriptional repressor LexA
MPTGDFRIRHSAIGIRQSGARQVKNSEKSPPRSATTSERLRWVREIVFGRRSKTAFARKLGMTLMQYDYYERRRALPLESLPRVMELTRIHPKWLYTGAGDPFLPEGVQFPEGGKAIDLINDLIEREIGRGTPRGKSAAREEAEGRFLPVLATASAAGHDRIAYNSEHAPGREKLPGDLHLIRVEGDSMVPVALPGQYILCTKDDPASGDLAVIELAEDDELYFKRVYYRGNQVEMVSVNPDPKYPPKLAPRKAVRRMHKVWGVKF